MTPDDDARLSAERLADEIRRGIREAAPHPTEDDRDSPALRAWAGAERYAIPAVPPGSAFALPKRLLLRLLRLVTRTQGTFNAKLLEGSRALERTVEALRRNLEDLDRRAVREHEFLHARIGACERPAVPEAAGAGRPAEIADGLYARFEEAFRGSAESIRERQRPYVDFFRGAPGPVLDCGCGRGEFVSLLAAAGIPARGVDANRVAVVAAERDGIAVEAGDAFAELSKALGALGGVAALQFVEHMEPAAVREFLGRAFEALAPGGRLLLETINPDSLYAMRAYRLDPTHRWPVPAATLSLLVRDAGFLEKEIRYVSPVPPGEALTETGENERKLNRWIFGFQDYALFAERPSA
ncbi:MAG TPA: class I SAM-dependent methyltransferase [Thermoanaerobaculia bacterium]|nr:class I SAM-dependent methyltransferase [Thermoanaerobaculia bacterium]